jgi:crotonobetainyl-CoA:carnitine CoA-transferase CaiB-like acyl-CoA transferase
MGVKTTLAGITFTAGGKQQAANVGVDLADLVAGMELACQELTAKLN